MSSHNFKQIPVVESVMNLIDTVLSRTQRKTATVVRKGWKISRIRSFYVLKVKFTAQNFREKLDAILNSFPVIDEMHPFLESLVNVLYSRDHLKLALGQVNSCRTTIDALSKDYSHLLKFGDSLYRCKALKRAALGRMVTAVKKLKASLGFLEQVRQHLSRLPSIDPSERTLILTGFPNVGKSSFINKVSRANVDVQSYAFTTKSLFVGHFFDRDIRYQVIDTPGLLDRELSSMSTIEMTAVTALAHLQSCVLFLIDISEACGYSIRQQVALYENVKPLFQGKPLLVVATKSDLVSMSQLDDEDRALVEAVARDRDTVLMEMSTVTEAGVSAVKTAACKMLLEHRVARKLQTRRVEGVLNRLSVARPEPRDDRQRSANIPASVLAARLAKKNKKKAGRGAAEGGGAAGAAAGAAVPGMDLDAPRTEKDVELEQGGPGIYQPDLRKHFMLKEEDWRFDAVPHIMDGKNVADFFADDVEERLNALEAEEEELLRAAEEESEVELDDELAAVDMDLAARLKKKKTLIKKAGELKRTNNKPVLPRRAHVRRLADLEKHLDDLGVDAARVRGRSRKRKSSVLARKMEGGAEGEDGDAPLNADMAERAKSVGRDASHSRGDGFRNKRQRTGAVGLGHKDQKKWSAVSRASESDRRVPDMKPKHLYSGKRGIGKTDRR